MPLPELTVRQVMDLTPAAVAPETRVQDVVLMMNQRRIGSVLVVEGECRLAGIFTERDLLKRVAGAAPGWREYPVTDWMTRTPHTIGPEVGWEEAVTRMHKLRVRHLPVLEDGRVVGIISTRLLMSRREEYLSHRIEERTAELREANNDLLARDAEILHNLRMAGRLQTRILLPPAPPERAGLRWAVHYAPLDHLGGDYYDFADEPGALGFLIADASGHSIAAAMVAMMARFAFAQSHPKTDPAAVLGAMNQKLQELTEERFVTAFYGVFDHANRQIHYSAAGHPYPLHYQADARAVKPLAAQGFLLGVIPDEVYTAKSRLLYPGDKVCFYTDGVSEARNEIGEMFGTERLTECLLSNAHEPAEGVVRCIKQALDDFRGDTPFGDDVTFAVADVLAP